MVRIGMLLLVSATLVSCWAVSEPLARYGGALFIPAARVAEGSVFTKSTPETKPAAATRGK